MRLEVLHTQDGSVTLLNKELNATYHSTHGAVQESRHIFIERGFDYAAQLFDNNIHVFEIGFGTGLNAFLTLQQSLKNQVAVRYSALEKFPVPDALFNALNFADLSEKEQEPLFKNILHCAWNAPVPITPDFELTKYRGDVSAFQFPDNIHLVYYDGFAPKVAPEMWQPVIFERLYHVMPRGAALVTFCAQGAFKRLLKETGFKVEALPGPPGKREMTRAIR